MRTVLGGYVSAVRPDGERVYVACTLYCSEPNAETVAIGAVMRQYPGAAEWHDWDANLMPAGDDVIDAMLQDGYPGCLPDSQPWRVTLGEIFG